jgi:hypothetical protein
MNFLFEYLIESTLAMGLVWLGYKFFLEKLTFFSWNRVYLLLGLIFGFGLPLISIPITWSESLPVQNLIPFGTVFSESRPSSAVTSSPWESWGLAQSLIMLWFLVATLLLSRLAYSVFALQRKIQHAEKMVQDGFTIALDASFSPSSFFGYVLLPKDSLDSGGLGQIVKHESSHIRFGHSVDLMLVQVLKGIFWFNPFLYLLEKSLKEVHEFQADSEVIKTFEAIPYSRLLVQSLYVSKTDFIPSFNQFQTKKRIVMMNKPKSDAREKSKFLMAIPLMFALLFLFSFQIGSSEMRLQGKWSGTDFKFEQSEGPDLATMVEGGKSLHINGKLRLNKNKTYQILDPSGVMNGNGTWLLDGEVLKMTDERQNEVAYQVVKVNDSELVTKHEVNMETSEGVVAGTIVLTYSKD